MIFPVKKRKNDHHDGIRHIWISWSTRFQLKLTNWGSEPNLPRKGITEPNNQSNKLQAFAFCVVNVNSTIVFVESEYFKNLIILNILKEKLVISCLLGSFYLNPLHYGGGKKHPTSFSHVTFKNVGISPLNFLTINCFVKLCKILRTYLVAISNYWTCAPFKKFKKVFWSNLYEIKVMITSLIVMLELPNFGHMKNLQYDLSHVIKLFWWRHGQNYDVISFISKRLQFCWHDQNYNHVF